MTQPEGDSSCLHVHMSGRDSSRVGSMDTTSTSSSTTATTTPAPILLSLGYCILIQTMATITEVHLEWCPAWNTSSMDYQIDLDSVSIQDEIVALREVSSPHISKLRRYLKTSSGLNSKIVHRPSHRTNDSVDVSTGQANSSSHIFEPETSHCPVEEVPTTLNVKIPGISYTVMGVRYDGLYPDKVGQEIRLAGLLCFPFGSRHFIFHMLSCHDGELISSSELGVEYAPKFTGEASGCTIYSSGKSIIRANNHDNPDGTSLAEINYRIDASGNAPLAQNVLKSWTALAIGTQRKTLLLVLEKSKESFRGRWPIRTLHVSRIQKFRGFASHFY